MRQDSAKPSAAPATDPLVSAVETVNRARRQLESLLEQIREDYRSVYAAFRDLDRQFKASGASPDTAGADVIDPRTSSDQLGSLRDSYAARSEEIVRLANAARRVETVLRQLDSSARYLLNPPDVLAIADATSSSSQLRALELQEDERQRLAREIHDGPAQVLANAIFQMEFCLRLVEKDPARLPAELAHLKSDLREGLAETRYFIFDLRSDQLAEIGLVAMLRRYVDSFQTRFGIEIGRAHV